MEGGTKKDGRRNEEGWKEERKRIEGAIGKDKTDDVRRPDVVLKVDSCTGISRKGLIYDSQDLLSSTLGIFLSLSLQSGFYIYLFGAIESVLFNRTCYYALETFSLAPCLLLGHTKN